MGRGFPHLHGSVMGFLLETLHVGFFSPSPWDPRTPGTSAAASSLAKLQAFYRRVQVWRSPAWGTALSPELPALL